MGKLFTITEEEARRLGMISEIKPEGKKKEKTFLGESDTELLARAKAMAKQSKEYYDTFDKEAEKGGNKETLAVLLHNAELFRTEAELITTVLEERKGKSE